MKKLILIIFALSIAFAGEGLPVLTLPTFAQDGYLPSSPVKNKSGVTFSYANWYLATDYSAISANFDDYEIGFKGLISDNIEIRGEVPTEQPVGTTAYYNTALYFGKKFEINDKWSIKARANLLSERLFYATSWGASLDAEVARTINVMGRVLVGVENLGWMSPLSIVGTQVPSRYYLGGDLIFNFFIVSIKGGINSDTDPFLRWGIRYFHPVFELSYSHDSLQRVHHAGAEIKWNNFRIGYGQYFHQDGLGYPMMVSFGMIF
ncbi:MAG: hypothetical protein U9O95_00685 [Candidatus Marinimicrobia bacterium]|nr:hypothetical protein [Candidatus Neomarinimicrobiota bacterium]